MIIRANRSQKTASRPAPGTCSRSGYPTLGTHLALVIMLAICVRGSAPFRDAQPDDPVGVAPEDLLAHLGGDVSLVPPGAKPLDMLEIELGVRVVEPQASGGPGIRLGTRR